MNAILELLASSAIAGYFGIILVLVICGFGIPIPEDIILVTGGYLAAVGPLHLPGVLIASFIGVIAGDAGIYWVGQRYGPALAQHRFLARLFPADKIVHAEEFFAKHGVKAVFFARFIVGLRAAVFFTSGYLRVPFARFVAADLLAALLSVPVWIWLGYAFHEQIENVMGWVRNAENALTAIILAAAAFLFVRWYFRRRRRLAADAARSALLGVAGAPSLPPAQPAIPLAALAPLSRAKESASSDGRVEALTPSIEDPARGGTVSPNPESVEESSA